MHSKSPDDTKRNWFAFYCKDRQDTAEHVSDCHIDPDYRCFSSWDSNWTLNAVLVKKTSMLKKEVSKLFSIFYNRLYNNVFDI